MISIIMPTYNRGYIIKKSIESVLSQSYTDFELIIIDDGSTDNTEHVVGAFCDARIVYIRNNKNNGACYARNIGLSKSKGEFIAFLDSDNIWDKNYLFNRIAKMKNGIGFIWGPILLNDFEGQHIIPHLSQIETIKKSSRKEIIRMMTYGNIIDTNTVVAKKEYLLKENGFDEKLKRQQDWDYFFRIIQNDEYEILFDDEILVENFLQEDSIGTDKNLGNYWEAVRSFILKYKKLITKDSDLLDVYKSFCLSRSVRNEKDLAFLNDLNTEEICELVYALSRQYTEIIGIYSKNCKLVNILNTWLIMNLKELSPVSKYMAKRKAKNVAVYGAGKIGTTLITEIKREKIDLVAIIDKNRSGEVIEGYSIISPEEYDDAADLVIISVIDIVDDIIEKYDKRGTFVSLEELINCLGDNFKTLLIENS